MKNTLLTLSTLITPEYNSMTLENLAAAYVSEGYNPSILATAFSKVYNLIITTADKYFGITEQDIASFALEELDKCLQTYDDSKSKFTTYFTVVFRNRLRMETEALSTHKRKAFLCSDSLDAAMENGFDIESKSLESLVESELLRETLRTYNLSDSEFKYCCLIIEGYKNSDIAEMLDVSVMTLCNLRKHLRTKLSPAFFIN